MFNVQFQQSSYHDQQHQQQQQQQQQKAFPSPITTSSLDSPPNKTKMNHSYMPLPPNSPPNYDNRQQQQQQYDYMSQQPIPIPSTASSNDPLVSPTSPGGSLEDEIVQRK
jgi:hypothetical protein